jgi:hypothetical protein
MFLWWYASIFFSSFKDVYLKNGEKHSAGSTILKNRDIFANIIRAVHGFIYLITMRRYLRRGVNEKGRVANDVETEQIIFEDVPEGLPIPISSVIQNRGSIPLFWSQETSRLNIKPDIIGMSSPILWIL